MGLPNARGSWICPTPAERDRFRDLHRRLQPVNFVVLAALTVLLLPFAFTLDRPLAVLPVIPAIAGFTWLQRQAAGFERPEVWVFTGLLGAEVAIAATALLSGVQPDPALTLLFWPAAGVAGRFRRLPVILGTAFVIVLIVACELLADVGAVTDLPIRVPLLVGALLCVVSLVMALRESDVEHRGAAVVDGLTGLLNRTALRRRVAEMEEQSADRLAPVAVAIIDVDFFKLVNDRHGHAAGDEILRELGSLLRTELRAYDQAYRLGGEEFVLLLPGAGLSEGIRRAERLRRAIEDHPGAVAVTASIGVAATAPGEGFVWDDQFEHADRELYAAKRAGRNRVHPVTSAGGRRHAPAIAVS